MIDFFDDLYYLLIKDNKGSLIWKLMRYIIRKTANIVLPGYFVLTRTNKKYKLDIPKDKHPQLIVSLTSFPTRINHLWKIIESLLRQSVKPDRIILWISEEQFHSENDVPKNLLKLKQRGLEIKIRKGNLRSHKKYFYTFIEYPNDICIIVDDDIFYRSNLIETLISLHNIYPDAVCFNHGRTILDEKGQIIAYNDGCPLKPRREPLLSNGFLPVGVGGVLYPPYSTEMDVINESVFRKICFSADDIWLWAMTYKHGTKFVYSGLRTGFVPVIIHNNITLCSTNNNGGNSEQFAKVLLYLKSNHDYL